MQLFDHLVGNGEHSGRERDAERLGGLEVDDELELGRLNHRQIGRLLAFENPPDIVAALSISIRSVGSVAHETASRRELPPIENNRDRIACYQEAGGCCHSGSITPPA